MQQLAHTIAVAMELPDSVMYGIANATFSVAGPAVTAFDQLARQAAPDIVSLMEKHIHRAMHPLSTKLPLMTPTYVLFGIVAYFCILLILYGTGKIIGKLQVRWLANMHNLALFSLSLYMSTAILVTAVANGFSLWNIPVGHGDGSWRLAKLLWLFYISKLPEFIDTFIMMLKHNYRQVTFLHLYHHSTIFIIWFFVLAEGPGGDAYWSAMLNSAVHVVMYGYYFGTSVFHTGPVRSMLNRIKFMITKGQMTQFGLNTVQSIYLIWFARDPKYPRHLTIALLIYMISLLLLFGNFLLRNNSKKPHPSLEEKKAASSKEKRQ